MDGNLQEFFEAFDVVESDVRKAFFFVRSRELQEESIRKLDSLQMQSRDLKRHFIDAKSEDEANILLSVDFVIEAYIKELKMWLALKDNDSSAAWEFLVDAQMSARSAIQAHKFGEKLNHFIYRLDALEKILFPPQVFVSPGFVIESSNCSICGSVYGECDHIKGKAYMGELCVEEVTKIRGVREVSIVKTPASKSSRMLNFTDGDITRDWMTWDVIKEE